MKKDQDRDERGRFASRDLADDSPPVKPVDDLIEEATKVAAELMRSRDKKFKADGAKLAVKIKAARKDEPGDAAERILDPINLAIVFKLFPAIQELAGKYRVDELEMIHRMGKDCVDCDRWEDADAGADDREDEQ
jgi:hypothetical protein